jgi:glycolate oxidase FAD binding subunit
MLVLRLAGASAAVESASRQLGGESVEPAMASAFWDGLRDQTDEFFAGAHEAVSRGALLWRLSVPAGTPPMRLGGQQLIEWGGAQRWLCSAMPAPAIREAARAVGGHAVLFRSADPQVRVQIGAFAALSPALERIHADLKRAFDPDGILNPGRLYAGF